MPEPALEWSLLGEVELFSEWRQTPVTEDEWFKVEQVNPPRDVVVEVAQTDGSLWKSEGRLLRSGREVALFNLVIPPMFSSRRLGFRIANAGLQVRNWKLKVFSMPFPNTSYGFGSATQGMTGVFPASTQVVQLLASNPDRKGAAIYNNSTEKLYLKLTGLTGPTSQEPSLGANAAALHLGPGDYYEMPYGYSGLIEGKWSAVNGAAFVTEFV
ncbi:hypothetical protein K9N68_10830 [Kovacikia minuta CCNUW1]|uniref:hypothetical protein n=1 Tax=Kovacikia minuta TaxID=2931930 RepID=UPI001CCD452E|nr:hypothetical protein [Kovacikia minuta]UBF28323.1 hypothetical protein K9N68_10830 [Kovacikia minuta CCNUW1]